MIFKEILFQWPVSLTSAHHWTMAPLVHVLAWVHLVHQVLAELQYDLVQMCAVKEKCEQLMLGVQKP